MVSSSSSAAAAAVATRYVSPDGTPSKYSLLTRLIYEPNALSTRLERGAEHDERGAGG